MRARQVDPTDIDPAVIKEAAEIITRGGLVAFPTETVYGLGADATNANAVGRIFEAKGRPSYNPLIVHAADVTGASRCVTSWPDVAQAVVERFWPGPLTIVLPKSSRIPDIVTAGLPTVGVRVPNHPVALALIRAAGVPIAAPSANRSMHVSPTLGDHVATSLGAAPDMILDAGPVSVGIESTVLDLSTDIPTVLRPGMISADDLRALIGRVEVASGHAPEGAARSSPGMMDRHYSPAARVMVVDAPDVITVAKKEQATGAKVVALVIMSEARDLLSPEKQIPRFAQDDTAFAVWRMPDTAAEYARLLYGMLHRADAEGFQVIVAEAVPSGSDWDGVRDRLRRAAH